MSAEASKPFLQSQSPSGKAVARTTLKMQNALLRDFKTTLNFQNIYETAEPNPEIFTTEKSRRIWHEIVQAKQGVQEQIQAMECSLQRVLDQHEYEYMQAYNVFVSNKETELKQLIDEVTNRLGDKLANQQRIKRLESTRQKMKLKCDEQIDQIFTLQHQLQEGRAQHDLTQEEKTYYHALLLESKKKQALLTQTVERLGDENRILRQKCEGLEADLLLTRQVRENLGLSSTAILDETFVTNTAQSA